MKKIFKKIESFILIIWIVPAFRYFFIAMLIAVIIGLITGRSPLYLMLK
jgi:hypothetical protein